MVIDTKLAFAELLKTLCDERKIAERGRQAFFVRLLKANGLKISQPGVKKYFDGEALPDTPKAVVIAKFFNINVNDLLSGNKHYKTLTKDQHSVEQQSSSYNWPFGDRITQSEYFSLTPTQQAQIENRIKIYLEDNSIKPSNKK